MAKLNEIENALRDYTKKHAVEIIVIADAVHVKMEYVYGEKGKELWREINGVIKGLGGEWVSDGKNSHWRIPSSHEVAKSKTLGEIHREQTIKPKVDFGKWLDGIISELQRLRQEIGS